MLLFSRGERVLPPGAICWLLNDLFLLSNLGVGCFFFLVLFLFEHKGFALHLLKAWGKT